MLEEKYELLKEGINDVGIFKAVFMAGGPGSGKSFVSSKLGLKALGLRPVNSDDFFEQGLKKAGLSLKMPEDEEESREAVRVHAKALTAKRQDLYVKGRLGLIIDSTARDVKKIMTQNKLLKQLGYETSMVFVNTTLETALERNANRTRSIPEKIVKSNHAEVRKSLGKLQGHFGRSSFIIIDNDGDEKDLEKATRKIYPRLKKFAGTLPDNKMVKAWHGALTMKPKDKIEPMKLAAGDQPVEKREGLKTFREQQELLEVTDKEINAMKKLSKDMEKVKKGWQTIAKMGDKTLKSTTFNREYKSILDAQQGVLKTIGTLTNLKIMQSTKREELEMVKEASFDSLSPAQKVQMYKLLSKGMDLPYGSPAFKKNKAEIDKLRKKLKLDEGENVDRVKEKQEREKETLAQRHADEMDDAKEKDFKDAQDEKKRERMRDEASDEVMATKEKIYKDLKKKRKYFEKEYGKEKADDIMHGTAMNMAKKQHKVAEGKFKTELSKQFALEALSMQQRRAIAMRMRRQAQKIARKRMRNKKRMKSQDQLLKKAQKMARDTLAKKMTGGKSLSTLSIGARIAIAKKLDKKKSAITRLAKKMLPKVKKGEVERLKKFRAQQSDKK
tara:strand:- start:943 stop:2784 length:1842 start_codon:yes stop_codon:yes gene_type:complete